LNEPHEAKVRPTGATKRRAPRRPAARRDTIFDDRAGKALRENEEVLRVIAANAPDYLVILNRDAEMAFLNRVPVGYRLEDVIGQCLYDYLLPEAQAPVREALERAFATGEPQSYETAERSPDGEIRWYSCRLGPVVVDGRVTSAVVIGRDVTERRRLDEQMQHAQKLESLGVLAGGIAHDFNNLLMGILGNADVARAKLPAEHPCRANLDGIVRASQRAADLCNQLLAYSGHGRFVTSTLQLGDIVREMAHLLAVSVSKKARLVYRLAPGVPPVDVDATQIRQVVMNLITNASEALGDRSGEITLETGSCSCNREYLGQAVLAPQFPEGECVYIEVRDTGCGMNAETRRRIFDPFFTTKFTGRGLGLAAVLGIVSGHRGGLIMDSAPDRGTSFRVLLPPGEEPLRAEPRPLEARTLARLTGTVLIVDDEPAVRSLARQVLEREGLTTLTARDGREGVRRFVEHADSISVVLLDMTMPNLSGHEAFREMRHVRPNARIILSSGYTEQVATADLDGASPAGFIQKPYLPVDLVAKVRQVMLARS
jgi:PAS domain S-box-containing protein